MICITLCTLDVKNDSLKLSRIFFLVPCWYDESWVRTKSQVKSAYKFWLGNGKHVALRTFFSSWCTFIVWRRQKSKSKPCVFLDAAAATKFFPWRKRTRLWALCRCSRHKKELAINFLRMFCTIFMDCYILYFGSVWIVRCMHIYMLVCNILVVFYESYILKRSVIFLFSQVKSVFNLKTGNSIFTIYN